jgi:fumarylacetoacetase
MIPQTDATHDLARRSWVESANGHAEFPIQNLPLGIVSPPGGAPRGGVAIGDQILDLEEAVRRKLLTCGAAQAAAGPVLNAFFALPATERGELRAELSALLAAEANVPDRTGLLYPAADCTMHMPAVVGDYTDFFAGIHHAMNVGRQFRPDTPLLPNYKYVPIGYHGRASSLAISGSPVRRPCGQTKPPSRSEPSYGPCRRLDYELEFGIWIGPGNATGQPIAIADAARHAAGFCLLNDWSARDIQAWEYQPLGPFLAKSFVTTISPWVVTAEALAPFRIAQPARSDGDPAPLPYLSDPHDASHGAFDIDLEVFLLTAAMARAGHTPHRVSLSNLRHLYWTAAQMVAHHSSGGCNLRPGDLFGTGTISTPDPSGYGSLLEATSGGKQKLDLPGGEQRAFLEDGDTVIFRAHARRDGFAPIGFGECRGTITEAPAS